MDKFSYISNAHGSYIEELYKSYLSDPESLDLSWQKFFEGYEFSQLKFDENGQPIIPDVLDEKELKIRDLIHAYRTRGHLRSNTNPVRPRKDRKALLDLADFGLSDDDLKMEFDAGAEIGIGRSNLEDIIGALQDIYLSTIGFEYMYIREPQILEWFKRKVEFERLNDYPSIDTKKRILEKLNEAVVFENFLHTKYLGQKRFSLEGGETTIPALDALINKAADLGVKEVLIGMAHRGRLNVLTNIMGKTYENIFNEFEGQSVPDLTMGDGDVKYHLGYSSQIVTNNGKSIDVKLAPNPSHLEAVNPVVEGFCRAKIDSEYNHDEDSMLPVLIHGDAAIAGQGIAYEVAQMSKLKGYYTGGTIHFVINNQVGFTTDFDDARSSIYCTDVAKIVDAPVLHVNGDDPEAVVFCMNLAMEFRQQFNRDIYIDMVCYRRHGHNESDEPKFTQPNLYNLISKHPNPREIYNKSLIEKGQVDGALAKSMDKEFRSLLQDRLNKVKQKPLPYKLQPLEEAWNTLRRSSPKDFENSPKTGVSRKVIDKVGASLVKIPDGFKPLKQIEKLLKQRKDMLSGKSPINWATAELLAYGSILMEGNRVRISGQDCQRGTFSHRHAVLRDAQTNAEYSSLEKIDESQAEFDIYNSLLSEFGVLGYEFGYAMANPNALVVWEAQFGDFANGAQVMIDQFISCSYTKWHRMNGVVLLLPHGYEGQGPEHSSARLERYLQSCAGNNMFVTNVTNPANYFHLLRRQLEMPFRMPLVVMSPKSLLRHPKAVCAIEDLTDGSFKEVLADDTVKAADVKHVFLCSGKFYFSLAEERERSKRKDIAIIRLEQLHPLPEQQIAVEIAKYTKKTKAPKIYWVQEESENMGAWTFILRSLRKYDLDVISRKVSASPATGFAKVHQQEEKELLKRAFSVK